MKQRRSNFLLVSLLNLLADFDGELAQESIKILEQLRDCDNSVPPLFADVFGLLESATCAQLVECVLSRSPEQLAISSYAFQVFRSYEQMLRVDTTGMNLRQRSASEAQMEQVRLSVERARSMLEETIGR